MSCKERVELKKEQLSNISGGREIPGHGPKCRPMQKLVKVEDKNGNLLSAKQSVCSDSAFKGTKPECENCGANI